MALKQVKGDMLKLQDGGGAVTLSRAELAAIKSASGSTNLIYREKELGDATAATPEDKYEGEMKFNPSIIGTVKIKGLTLEAPELYQIPVAAGDTTVMVSKDAEFTDPITITIGDGDFISYQEFDDLEILPRMTSLTSIRSVPLVDIADCV